SVYGSVNSAGTVFAFVKDMSGSSLSKIAIPVLVTMLSVVAACSPGCGPTMPPTQAPAPPNPTFEPLRDKLQAYIDLTQAYRKEAAQAQEKTPGKAEPTPSSAAALRTRQN